MAENKSQWLSIGEAAKYLGISRDTLRRWEKAGRIKPVRSPTNRRYYTKKILDEILGGKIEPINEEKVSKKAPRLTLSSSQKLILIGSLSFLFAVTFVLCLQLFFFG